VEIREHADGETHVLWVEGELDLSTIPELTRRIDAELGGRSEEALTIDLSDVTFMDSSGLRLLIELDKRARDEGWKLALRPSRHEGARVVLRMTGADEALPFEEDAQP
jgi:anti-sigma B factor antagonist